MPRRAPARKGKPPFSAPVSSAESSASAVRPRYVIAIVGRPNVGKSSLFNCMCRDSIAVTSHISGSTRDFNRRAFALGAFDVVLVDSGGLDPCIDLADMSSRLSLRDSKVAPNIRDHLLHSGMGGKTRASSVQEDMLRRQISVRSYSLVHESDLVIYLVDGLVAPSELDVRIFRRLSSIKRSILVVNKVDNDSIRMRVECEFVMFGADFVCVSAVHNIYVAHLLSRIESEVSSIPSKGGLAEFSGTDPISSDSSECISDLSDDRIVDGLICVAIVGRPNVGKSSLLNALVGSDRAVTSDVPGTTIDPVDEVIEYRGHKIRFIDTAGIRQPSRISGIHKHALLRTRRALSLCHVAILVLDASDDMIQLDEKICSEVFKNNLASVVVFNKCDIKKHPLKRTFEDYKRRFRFLDGVPVVAVSAHTGKHLSLLKDKILQVFNDFCFRIPTARLNAFIADITRSHPLPRFGGKPLKIYYATQVETSPMRILLNMNRGGALHFSYKRYIINSIRKEFNLSGVPVLIDVRGKIS